MTKEDIPSNDVIGEDELSQTGGSAFTNYRDVVPQWIIRSEACSSNDFKDNIFLPCSRS